MSIDNDDSQKKDSSMQENEHEEIEEFSDHTDITDIDESEGEIDITDQRDYKKEYEELYDRFIRLAADFDNYKKRMTKEKSDIAAYGNEELIKSLLDVVDNLERAIEHSESGSANDSLAQGVQLVHNQLLNCLQRFGVEKINAEKGTEFDPRHHQAFERVETDEYQPGVVLSEMVKGYKLKDRLLRPSIVSVSADVSRANAHSGEDQVNVNIDIDDEEDSDIIDLNDEEEQKQ